MKKAIIIIILVLIILVLGFFILNRYIYNEKQVDVVLDNIITYEECVAAGYPVLEIYPEQCVTPDGRRFTRDISGEDGVNNLSPITIQGSFVCLPDIDTSGPQTLGCAFGLLADNGEYYALQDSDPNYSNLSSLGTENKIEIRGMFRPELSEKYQSIGVIVVEDVYSLDVNSSPRYNIPELEEKYVSLEDWDVDYIEGSINFPEKYTVVNGRIDCEETPDTSSVSIRTSKRVIDSQTYCIEASSEGAAGSVFTEYEYVTLQDSNMLMISFVARYPECSNYEDTQRSECERERENFNLDEVVSDVFDSISLMKL